jgi:phosphomevalonate kinase
VPPRASSSALVARWAALRSTADGRCTMRARAPGKLVLSGAYSVLRGAPALVSAVTRYAFATIGAPATFESEEVRAFLDTLPPEQRPPHPQLDAAALRTNVPGGSRKLGLGSSAALLSAAIMVVLTDLEQKEPFAEDVFWRAFDAHRRAQGGGSFALSSQRASLLGRGCACPQISS